ncbi:MAG: ABC transporter permease [Phycisphaerae bacterium]|nr:ABC transporter permease [Phycisphaerae bacterium]
MGAMTSVLKRELGGYFATPVAYVFIVIFLVLCGVFTFTEGLGSFFERGQAGLTGFFSFHPWLYLFLIPALSMRLWAEERRSGTIELLMTLPIRPWAAVLGKYLAAWAFTAIALALTFPLWITVNQLGEPDNRAIAASYFGSFLMAGGFLAIGSALSSLTKSQVIAFVLSVVGCFAVLLPRFLPGAVAFVASWFDQDAGSPTDLPLWLTDTLNQFSVVTQFAGFQRGVIGAPAVIFFLTLIGGLLIINTCVIDSNKAS